MVLIAGGRIPRHHEKAALALTAVLIGVVVVAPVLYVVLLPLACAIVSTVAPIGRRLPVAMATWFPISAAVLVGTNGLGFMG